MSDDDWPEDEGASLLVDVKWPNPDKPIEGRCPTCALPVQWVHRDGKSRWNCAAWERHAQLDRMKRAASACFSAGYTGEAERISRDIDRLLSPLREVA